MIFACPSPLLRLALTQQVLSLFGHPMNGTRKSHSFLTEAVLPAQSKPGIRVLVAGTENILDNLYFGALQLSLPLQAPFEEPLPFLQSSHLSVC